VPPGAGQHRFVRVIPVLTFPGARSCVGFVLPAKRQVIPRSRSTDPEPAVPAWAHGTDGVVGGLSGSRCRCSAAVRPEYSLGISLSWTNWRCSMMPLNQSVATCSLLAGRVGVQVVGAGEDLGGDTG
jgi:hypothetical protein